MQWNPLRVQREQLRQLKKLLEGELTNNNNPDMSITTKNYTQCNYWEGVVLLINLYATNDSYFNGELYYVKVQPSIM